MRNTTLALIAAAIVASAALPMAVQAQDYRRGEDRGDTDYGRPATLAQLAAADRRLNDIYQRRVNEARADDRRDRRFRGWYSQEAALRDSERLWINFRDAECRYLTQQDVGERDYRATMRGCLLEQTNDRIGELREARQLVSQR